MVPMLLESDAYADGAIVPAKYSNAGGSTMPAFKITNIPMGTVSFAVIFHDIEPSIGNPPGDVLHALFWNVPAASAGWPEGPQDGSKMPAGTVMGNNITGKPIYMGPGAPAGPRYHHYIFEVYALNANLDLPQPLRGRHSTRPWLERLSGRRRTSVDSAARQSKSL
jgi:Raf kinase inhibitor-like YbhB/YbcL family protein